MNNAKHSGKNYNILSYKYEYYYKKVGFTLRKEVLLVFTHFIYT